VVARSRKQLVASLGLAADRDVPESGLRPYFDLRVACPRALGGVEAVVHVAEGRVEVKPGGNSVGDPYLDTPGSVSATSEPRWMLPTRMWPLAVLALIEPRECSTAMSPFAALTRRSPPTSVGGTLTTNSGSLPRRRSSTEPGAGSLVISAAAAERASSRVSRAADSSAAVSRWASASAC
jgi:hypothetical protein